MKIAISIVLMGFFTISFAQKSDSTRWLKVGELEIGQDEKWAIASLS